MTPPPSRAPLRRLGVKHPRVADTRVVAVMVIAHRDRVHVDIHHPPRQVRAMHRTGVVLCILSCQPAYLPLKKSQRLPRWAWKLAQRLSSTARRGHRAELDPGGLGEGGMRRPRLVDGEAVPHVDALAGQRVLRR